MHLKPYSLSLKNKIEKISFKILDLFSLFEIEHVTVLDLIILDLIPFDQRLEFALLQGPNTKNFFSVDFSRNF